jgi:hypothetical protein|nr:MAG: hypothetical protein [Lake Baikal virophage 12]
METTHKHAVALTDDDYSRIDELVRKNGKRGVKLTDKKGVVNRFYRKDGELYCDQYGANDTIFTQECMKLSDIQNTQKAPFESAMKQKLKADYPTMTQEEVDAYADVIAEANESIKRLISNGVEPQLAHGMITEALRGKEIIGNVEKKVENEIINP